MSQGAIFVALLFCVFLFFPYSCRPSHLFPLPSSPPFSPLSGADHRVELCDPEEPSEVGRLCHKALEVVNTLPLIDRGGRWFLWPEAEGGPSLAAECNMFWHLRLAARAS